MVEVQDNDWTEQAIETVARKQREKTEKVKAGRGLR